MVLFVSSFEPNNGIGIYSKYLVSELARIVDVSRIELKREWGFSYPLKLYTLIKGSNDPLVHFQHEYLLYGTPAQSTLFPLLLRITRKLEKRIVVTLHTVIPRSSDLSLVFGSFPRAKDMATVFVTRQIAMSSDRIVVMTELMKKVLKSAYGIDSVIIPHGGDHSISSLMDAKEQLGLEGYKVILYLGFIHPHKGIHTLIDAFARLGRDDTYLIVAGGIDPTSYGNLVPYLKMLRRKAMETGLSGRIQFTGFVDDRTRDLLYSASDIVVFPYERQGVVSASGAIQFAIAYRKLIVVSSLPVLVEELGNYRRGLIFNLGDSTSLCQRMSTFLEWELSHPSEEPEAHKPRPTWRDVALMTSQMYKDVMAQPP